MKIIYYNDIRGSTDYLSDDEDINRQRRTLFVQGNYSALRTFPGLKLTLFLGSALCSPVPMFPRTDVPRTYVPRYRCVPGTYVPRFTANVLDVVIGIGIQSELFEEKNEFRFVQCGRIYLHARV